ncbi:helix-turn-helix domain-containing protein [Plebeiibacterium marinum]|uniref:Helix-turn-helix domain-containing protein n=1 Tax=Plebeiibacterium marinum TaxID=2992111 RepID=A0AAE3SJ89_9BACT|nr:helix-turn-helix domain-containing protein [Plebeiobacterium marinum]MCW3805477.1 helix-turn-helix domain-containing protein [Plebeiobacterium marinum]
MKNLELSKRVKELRTRKGLSQEELSEDSGLSLRTIQRIENGETEPRGDSLKKLANSLGASPDELIDWTIQENRGYLVFLNLSSLTFILFPLLGFLIPFIMLSAKKDKIKDINMIGSSIVNYQITWNLIALPFLISFSILLVNIVFLHNGYISIPELVAQLILILLYLYNLTLILINSLRIYNNKKVRYFPRIRFIKM